MGEVLECSRPTSVFQIFRRDESKECVAYLVWKCKLFLDYCDQWHNSHWWNRAYHLRLVEVWRVSIHQEWHRDIETCRDFYPLCKSIEQERFMELQRGDKTYFAAWESLAGGFGIFRNSCRISADVLTRNSVSDINLYGLLMVIRFGSRVLLSSMLIRMFSTGSSCSSACRRS